MHETHFYPEINHEFHNNTTPIFDKKTVDLLRNNFNFFKNHLKQITIILIRKQLVFKLF